MGMMNRMRENTGIVLWILVVSFGGLWVLQDSGVFDTIGTDPLGKVIVVDGDIITREEYNGMLEYQLEQMRLATNSTLGPEQVEVQRERVFNTLVDDRLRVHQMDRLGITVSDSEVQELIVGPQPHQVILANFANEEGQLDRSLLQSVIDAPEQEATWVQIEEFIRQDRRREKLNGLLQATVRVSDSDVMEAWLQEGSTANAEYFFLRYADVADSTVALTGQDVEEYYEDHIDEYQRERVYSIELASLSKLASAEDTAAVMNEVERLRSGFETAEDDSLHLASIGSEAPWSEAFLGPADMDPAVAQLLFEGEDIEPGLIVGPAVEDGMVQLIKVLEVRDAEETNVRARHILVGATEGSAEEEAAARAQIRDVQQRLAEGELFGDIAVELSDDPGSGALRGDLGWFGEGRMVPAFEDAAFNARIGQVVGPIKTQFGFHLIETTARADVEVRVARLGVTLDASVATLNAITEALEDLSYFAEESGNFSGEAARRYIRVEPMDMEAEQIVIPGMGISRALAKFLEEANEGDISPIIELNDVAIMVHVVSIQEEGTQALAEVEAIVRPQALLEKKKSYQRERMAEAYSEGGFDGLVQALAQQPSTAEGVSFGNLVIPSLGRDPLFVGIALGLEQGEDSGVMDGANAVFVVKTVGVSTPGALDEDALGPRRTDILNERRNLVTGQWIALLREQSDIEDLRTDLLPQVR